MNKIETGIAQLVVLEPKIYEDDRGYFYESYNSQVAHSVGIDNIWVQDNEARSTQGVLRGLHFQKGKAAQAKLVRVTQGEVLDVVVDLRSDSLTFGKSFSILLNDISKKQLYVPRGFAHGYAVLSDIAVFAYKCDNFYDKSSEGGLIYNDPELKIDWLIDESEMIISEKDQVLPNLADLDISSLGF